MNMRKHLKAYSNGDIQALNRLKSDAGKKLKESTGKQDGTKKSRLKQEIEITDIMINNIQKTNEQQSSQIADLQAKLETSQAENAHTTQEMDRGGMERQRDRIEDQMESDGDPSGTPVEMPTIDQSLSESDQKMLDECQELLAESVQVTSERDQCMTKWEHTNGCYQTKQREMHCFKGGHPKRVELEERIGVLKKVTEDLIEQYLQCEKRREKIRNEFFQRGPRLVEIGRFVNAVKHKVQETRELRAQDQQLMEVNFFDEPILNVNPFSEEDLDQAAPSDELALFDPEWVMNLYVCS